MGCSWMSQPVSISWVLPISGKDHLKLSLDDILASDIIGVSVIHKPQ